MANLCILAIFDYPIPGEKMFISNRHRGQKNVLSGYDKTTQSPGRGYYLRAFLGLFFRIYKNYWLGKRLQPLRGSAALWRLREYTWSCHGSAQYQPE